MGHDLYEVGGPLTDLNDLYWHINCDHKIEIIQRERKKKKKKKRKRKSRHRNKCGKVCVEMKFLGQKETAKFSAHSL